MATKKYMSLDRMREYDTLIKEEIDGRISANKTVVDSSLSPTSSNPVENKVLDAEFEAISTAMNVYDAALDDKADTIHTHAITDISDLTTTATELNYMQGATSNIQSQLDNIDYDMGYLNTELNKKAGLKTQGMTYIDADGNTQTCGNGEVFNHYNSEQITLNESGVPTNGNLATHDYSHAEGSQTIASGFYSHAEGLATKASGASAHTEGNKTIASGVCSHAEGLMTTAGGRYSHAEGYQSTTLGDCAHAGGYSTIAMSYQTVTGKYNLSKNAPVSADTQDSTGNDAIFIVGYGTSTTPANAFRITSGGKCRGVSTFTASGADFAELFEWKDGNPDNEDRRGLFVALDGEKIKLANADDDYIGVISGAQSFVGNTASEEWQGKYLTDVFGARLSQKVEIPEKIDEATGDVIPAHTTTQFIVNPDYNPDEEYIMRESRKEWGIVGLLGQVVVIDDGTCTVGGYVKPLANGIGTASDTGYRVMKRIDENHIKVLVK